MPNPKRANRTGFYSLVMMLNGFLIVMFQVVTTPAPTVRAYEAPRPVVRKVVAVESGTPNRLVVESVGIDIPVGVGTYNQDTGEWTLGNDQVYYADTSVPVNNNNGITLIYGHAQDGLFGSLSGMQVGATATVYTDKGQLFHYRFEAMKQLDPADTSIFTSTGPPTLTLQTCAGEWDAYRAMYTFQFAGHENA